ncbi:MAG: isocitrate lyase/PEP mutase family protein [Succiniclasticum sp.]|nr:isocitrate lyase/PEP mutase family protein [Succiniclasticum sp.]
MTTKNEKLRTLINGKETIIAPCAYDALSLKAIAAAGFSCAGTTGFGMHGAILGQPDNGLLAFNEMAAALSKMTDAVDIPVMADAEGGYGSALNVIRTVHEFEKIGISGLFIEDQKNPPNCPFIKPPETISVDEMVGKIRAALDARKDKNFVIVARTDAPFEEGVRRANIYLEAGADMVKVLPKNKNELLEYPALINGPIHLGLYRNKGLNDGMTAYDCGKIGYKIITYPMDCLFSATASLLGIMKWIKDHGTDEGYEGPYMNFSDYLNFIGADKYKENFLKYIPKN